MSVDRAKVFRQHDFSSEKVETLDGPRLRIICKCGFTNDLKINSGTGTGINVNWKLHMQDVFAKLDGD